MSQQISKVQLKENVSLQQMNTFGIEVKANYFASFSTENELITLLKDDIVNSKKMRILGGGSNILLTADVDHVVLKNELKGIEELSQDKEFVKVRVAAGESWHDFVVWCVERDFQGAENMSLIPGTVGAAPMQNIGAYGAEAKDIIEYVHAIKISDGTKHIFNNERCHFGYRESIFKNEVNGQYIITAVDFKLNKVPQFNISYGAIKDILAENKVEQLTCKAISDAVIAIRKSKLPDPKDIGNSGSFFKNPEIAVEKYAILKDKFPDMPSYPVSESIVKVPAGWLIEQCQWKGYRKNDYGVHAKQALVLVNYGSATGQEIYELSSQILESVKEKFDITLSREVNIW